MEGLSIAVDVSVWVMEARSIAAQAYGQDQQDGTPQVLKLVFDRVHRCPPPLLLHAQAQRSCICQWPLLACTAGLGCKGRHCLHL